MRTIAIFVSTALFAVAAQAQVLVLQPLTTFGTHSDGSVRPGDVTGLTAASQLQRGLAYNPITGHLLLVDRATNSSVNYFVYILDGATGAQLGTLPNISPLDGGNASFPLNLVGVADDGAIYAANLTSATATNETRIYRWASETDSPTLVSPALPPTLADDPGAGDSVASQKRWGDTMAVRGSGLGTQILLANRGTFAALFTPDDGSYAHFTPKRLTADVATGGIGTGLTFGAGDTFWGTSGANGNGPLYHLAFNAGAGTATMLTNFPSSRVPGTISPILVMPSSNLLAGITMVTGADVVRLYDITDTNNPVLLDRKNFATTTANNVFGGSLALGTNGVLYALDSDNGIMAFTLVTVGSNPLTPEFFLNPASQTAVVSSNVTFTAGADSTLPVNYEWRFFGTNFNSSATNASLSLTNVQLTNAGNYSVVASNASGSVTSSVAILTVNTTVTVPETWNLAIGGSWNSTASWNPVAIPNAIGQSVTFNNAASGSNVAQTANVAVTLDGTKTVGSIAFNNNAVNAFTYSIGNGTGGPLVFDETNVGPATITVNSISGATGNNTISATTTLTDSLVATVNNTTASSGAGALNLTAAISGPGGFTKLGDGLATFGTGAKTYTGPTVLSGGRMRISVAAQPSATSSFTINAGGQLNQITAGSLTFGSGPLNLNGAGPTTGPYAAFPGAIRNDTDRVGTINNAVVLQSDTLIHVEGAAASTTFANAISGPGKLTLTAPSSSANQGQLVLNGANTYQGGTLVRGGTLVVSGAAATLGTGDVTLDNAGSPSSTAKLNIQSSVANAISDVATLTIAGSPGVQLDAGVNETVGGLKLGGVSQVAGTYGSTASGATFQNDTYFSGSGIVTLVPFIPPPSLKIALSAPNVILFWSTNGADGYNLVSNANLVTPRSNWTTVANSVVVVGTNKTVTVNVGSANTFFGLRKLIP